MKKILSLFLSLVMIMSITFGLNINAQAYEEGEVDDLIAHYTIKTGEKKDVHIRMYIELEGGEAFTNPDSSVGAYDFEFRPEATAFYQITVTGSDDTELTVINNDTGDELSPSSSDNTLYKFEEGSTYSIFIACNDDSFYETCIAVSNGDLPAPYVYEENYTICITASDFEEQAGDFIYALSDNDAIITGYTGNAGSVVIPDEVNGHKVIAIGEYAFFGYKEITSITIPETVIGIGSFAFELCMGLRSINLPESVELIGFAAFSECANLDSIKIPNDNCIIEDQGSLEEIFGSKVFTNGDKFLSVESYPNTISNIYGIIITPDEAAALDYNNNNYISIETIPQKTAVSANHNSKGYQFAAKYNMTFDALDPHSYTSEIEQEATCSLEGVLKSTCTSCGAVKRESIDKAAHTKGSPVITKVEPTCTRDGNVTEVIYCTVCNEALSVKSEAIPAKGHSYRNVVTKKATLSSDGKLENTCSTCKDVKSSSVIPKITSIKLSAASYVYDGKAKAPKVTVKDSKGKAIAASNYTVTYASGRKNVGKYAVKITFKGNYSGTKTLYFTIIPKGTTISQLTSPSKKALTVKWKKQATQTTGYQIQYSTDANFKKNNKTVTVSKNGTTSKKITKLTSKKYYVRIRTYKTVKVNGKATKIYSGWSKAKSVKIK